MKTFEFWIVFGLQGFMDYNVEFLYLLNRCTKWWGAHRDHRGSIFQSMFTVLHRTCNLQPPAFSCLAFGFTSAINFSVQPPELTSTLQLAGVPTRKLCACEWPGSGAQRQTSWEVWSSCLAGGLVSDAFKPRKWLQNKIPKLEHSDTMKFRIWRHHGKVTRNMIRILDIPSINHMIPVHAFDFPKSKRTTWFLYAPSHVWPTVFYRLLTSVMMRMRLTTGMVVRKSLMEC